MCGPEAKQDICEIWAEVGEFLHGIVCTYHGKRDDETAQYLESIKGDGEVVYSTYCRRHDFSRNQYLYCGPIQNGDWCVQIDVLERIPRSFAQDLLAHIEYFKSQNINLVYFHSKAFIFEFHDSLQYGGNPHEGLRRTDGKAVAIELNNIFKDESKVRYSVRHLKRDKYHFVDGHLKYYLFPYGSNHCLLGLEKNCDGTQEEVRKLFVERETRRMEFFSMLEMLELKRDFETIKLLVIGKMPPSLIKYFNEEKILNDFYRYHALNDRSFNDDHDWKNMVKIE